MGKTAHSFSHRCELGVKFRHLPFRLGQELYRSEISISDSVAFNVSVKTGPEIRGLHHFELAIENSGNRKVRVEDLYLKRNGFRLSKSSLFRSGKLAKRATICLGDVIVDYEDHRWCINIEFVLEIGMLDNIRVKGYVGQGGGLVLIPLPREWWLESIDEMGLTIFFRNTTQPMCLISFG